jgi:methylthioribose-1-phosphate isomerase
MKSQILNSRALRLKNLNLEILDQQLLPFDEKWISVESPLHMIDIIKALKVRGAPLIGVAAVLSLAVWAEKTQPSEDEFINVAQALRESRPTAVNLMNAIDRVLNALKTSQVSQVALEIFNEDVDLCEKMGRVAGNLISEGDGVLTHCNTGGLATVGRGTAFAALSYAWEQKKKFHVYVDETRPLLQGGRLTAWELYKEGIPHTLICDNMAGFLMAQGKIQKIFVGTDRIAMNGDIANKVGTYSVAVLAHYHKIPFYVVGPWTTIDPQCATGKEIPIEERKAFEVRGVEGSFGKVQWAFDASPVYNPAFDVTPVDLITGIVIDDQLYSQNDLKQGKLQQIFK